MGGEAFGEVDVTEEGVEGGGVFAEFGGLFEVGLGEGGLAAVAIDDAAEEVGPGVGFVAIDERVEERFGLFDAAEDDAALGEGALVADVFGGFFGEGFEDGQGELGAAGAHVDAGEVELFLFGGGLRVRGDHGEELGGEAGGIGGEGGGAGGGGERAAVEVVDGETEEMENCGGDVGEAGVVEEFVGGEPGSAEAEEAGAGDPGLVVCEAGGVFEGAIGGGGVAVGGDEEDGGVGAGEIEEGAEEHVVETIDGGEEATVDFVIGGGDVGHAGREEFGEVDGAIGEGVVVDGGEIPGVIGEGVGGGVVEGAGGRRSVDRWYGRGGGVPGGRREGSPRRGGGVRRGTRRGGRGRRIGGAGWGRMRG